GARQRSPRHAGAGEGRAPAHSSRCRFRADHPPGTSGLGAPARLAANVVTTEDQPRMAPNTTNTRQLAALVDAKLQVLKVLVRLSRRQVELIDTGDMTMLIKLLAAKQTVMGQLQALEQ